MPEISEHGASTQPGKRAFEDYDGFVEKFKPKKTTDDCYTPPEVMEVVNRYVAERWRLDPATGTASPRKGAFLFL